MEISELIATSHASQRKALQGYVTIQKKKIRIQIIQQSLKILETFRSLALDSKDPESNAIRELTIRAEQTIESATLLALGGFEIQAMGLLRDVLEIEFLFRYFLNNSDKISTWLKANRRTRLSVFSPATLRRGIAGGDKELLKRMDADYFGHCEIATHPTPASLFLQRSGGGDPGQELSIWSSIIEIAWHARSIASLIGAIGTVVDSEKSSFETLLREMDSLTSQLESDKKALAMVLAARLGSPFDKEAIQKLLSKKPHQISSNIPNRSS